MARRHVTIFVNAEDCEKNHVRTFGGNGCDVREIRDLYSNMTKEEFLVKHPKFVDMCKEKFELYIYYE